MSRIVPPSLRFLDLYFCEVLLFCLWVCPLLHQSNPACLRTRLISDSVIRSPKRRTQPLTAHGLLRHYLLLWHCRLLRQRPLTAHRLLQHTPLTALPPFTAHASYGTTASYGNRLLRHYRLLQQPPLTAHRLLRGLVPRCTGPRHTCRHMGRKSSLVVPVRGSAL